VIHDVATGPLIGGLLPAVYGDGARPWPWLGVAALVFSVWVALVLVMAAATMPRLPEAGPTTTLPGPEAPAVADLLVHRWRSTSAAASATLVDLAARRHLDIDRLGDGTLLLRVRTVRATPDELTPWEHEVLALVHARAVNGELPAPALLEGASVAWFDRFRSLVERHAVEQGLARRRWSPWMGVVAVVPLAAALAAAMLAADIFQARHATPSALDDSREWGAVSAVSVVVAIGVVSALARRTRGLRHTPAGYRACAHWLGVRRAYVDTDGFRHTTAAAVAVWDRHLAVACAVGAAPVVAAAFPLGPEPDDEAWSPASGLWREVDVLVPRRTGEGLSPRTAIGHGALATLTAAAALALLGWLVVRVAHEPLYDTLREQPVWTGRAVATTAVVVLGVPTLWAVVTLARWCPVLLRGLADRHATVTMEGVVVKHPRRVVGSGDRQTVLTYVAIDDGSARVVRALCWNGVMPPLYSRVSVEVTPRLRHVRTIRASEAGASTAFS
jgi:hypothetical protein